MFPSLTIVNSTDCVSLKPSWHMLCQCQSSFSGSFRIQEILFFQSNIHKLNWFFIRHVSIQLDDIFYSMMQVYRWNILLLLITEVHLYAFSLARQHYLHEISIVFILDLWQIGIASRRFRKNQLLRKDWSQWSQK